VKLFLDRGASHGELAGLLGISRRMVAKRLRRLLSAAMAPGRLALVNAWPRLHPEEQRLAYLHLILEMPLHEIARLGLMRRVDPDGSAGPHIARVTLGRHLRQIMRKVERVAAAAQAAAGPSTRQDR
jgi:DNA-binding HxlR family transcriptional regulator